MDTNMWILVLVVAAVLVAALAAAIVLTVRLVRTRRSLRRAGLPTGPRWVFWGAIAYVVLPTDLMPDPAYFDDIAVLLLALRSMRASSDPLPRDTRGSAWQGPPDKDL
jgi:uncharacterized membrane protein YkvA (DUF1232 family)